MKTIKEQISEFTTADFDVFNIIVDNVNILSSNVAIAYLQAKYNNFKTENLKSNWILFLKLSQQDINRAYTAFYSEYNPIDNYNGVETHTIIENTGKKVNKNTGGTTTENMSTTFENENYRPTEKTDTSFNNLESTEEFENTSIGDNNGHHVTVDNFAKHGNLGVTQTQQMIENEMSLRMYPYCTRLIDRFVTEYCYLCEGSEM